MNGRPMEVGKFAYELRMKIFKEHCGEVNENLLQDPFSDSFQEVWDNRALRNTEYFRSIFRCYPDDEIEKLEQVKGFKSKANLDSYHEISRKIVGHIVEFPLKFLSGEELKPDFFSLENLILPDPTFT